MGTRVFFVLCFSIGCVKGGNSSTSDAPFDDPDAPVVDAAIDAAPVLLPAPFDQLSSMVPDCDSSNVKLANLPIDESKMGDIWPLGTFAGTSVVPAAALRIEKDAAQTVSVPVYPAANGYVVRIEQTTTVSTGHKLSSVWIAPCRGLVYWYGNLGELTTELQTLVDAGSCDTVGDSRSCEFAGAQAVSINDQISTAFDAHASDILEFGLYDFREYRNYAGDWPLEFIGIENQYAKCPEGYFTNAEKQALEAHYLEDAQAPSHSCLSPSLGYVPDFGGVWAATGVTANAPVDTLNTVGFHASVLDTLWQVIRTSEQSVWGAGSYYVVRGFNGTHTNHAFEGLSPGTMIFCYGPFYSDEQEQGAQNFMFYIRYDDVQTMTIGRTTGTTCNPSFAFTAAAQTYARP